MHSSQGNIYFFSYGCILYDPGNLNPEARAETVWGSSVSTRQSRLVTPVTRVVMLDTERTVPLRACERRWNARQIGMTMDFKWLKLNGLKDLKL